jgi:arylformamidase
MLSARQFHFDGGGGGSSDAVDLNPLIGPARAISLIGRLRIRRERLKALEPAGTPRALVRTDAWGDRTLFPTSIPVMDEDVPVWLQQQGVVLVGVDVASIEPLDSKTLSNRHALSARGITNLEGLDLSEVTAGR